MSDLLPNLNALLERLVGDGQAVRDARTLAEAVAHVETEGELDAALHVIVSEWRQG
ncbi:hypothetical protein [Mycolicibacterium sp. P9-64]|uniref:hypothetical protein n=1 Tax=Mycolicibacterium sp. P9-64 TaxID=2024612 RepID=UPI001563D49C|nr:hypothetical protein [Mycolicibacterium sp. P9-64]